MKKLIARIFGTSKAEPTMLQNTDVAASVNEKINPHKKPAWVPTGTEGDNSLNGSKFSGIAYIPEGEKWPECGHCQKPMQLFVQINSEDLPDEAKHHLPEGILQLFYCTNWDKECEMNTEAYLPFSKGSLARIVIPTSEAEPINASPVKDAFPPKKITNWVKVVDVPNVEELDSLGTKLTDQEFDHACDTFCPETGEKIGGWPAWVQGIEYPSCPECNAQMSLLFQVDSEKNIPYMFGDEGCSHITQCSKHKDKLAIAWSCS